MTEQNPPPYYIIDGALSSEELLALYHDLQSAPKWTLTRQSNSTENALAAFGSFPGFNVEDNGQIHDEYFSGYFRCLTFRIRKIAAETHGLKLPQKIARIHIGAKNSTSKTEYHKDTNIQGAWTILGFMNPVWNAKDGGELKIEEDVIQYKTGRFVLFPSNLLHDGGFVKNEQLSYWRITLNIVLIDELPQVNGTTFPSQGS